MLDTTWSIETPEGITLDLRVAGPVVRAQAWLIDVMIRSAAYISLGIILAMLGRAGMGVFLIVFFLIEWFYPVCFEVLGSGQTLGKRVMGLRVLCEDGSPVSWSVSMTRNILLTADFLPLFYTAGLLAMLLSRNFQRLGDLAAGTLVVYTDRPLAPKALEPLDPLSPSVHLGLAEQRAIVAFAERAPTLTTERSQELADLASDLTGIAGNEGLNRLKRIASGLRGAS
jgi:uncharacterized RDD family membrane protein YckC